MTREEAKAYIIRHCNPDYPKGKTEWETAINMAIKALSREPSEDCISRKALLAHFYPWLKVEDYSIGERNMLKALLYEVKVFPPAKPEPRSSSCGQENDMISRQMLLEYIHGEPVGKLLCDKYNLDGLIEQFPSAQLDFDITAKIDKAYDDGYEAGYLQGRHDWGDLDE